MPRRLPPDPLARLTPDTINAEIAPRLRPAAAARLDLAVAAEAATIRRLLATADPAARAEWAAVVEAVSLRLLLLEATVRVGLEGLGGSAVSGDAAEAWEA
jgi:hypothetical protein